MQGLRDLGGVYQERRTHIVEMAAELDAAHRSTVEGLVEEADRRIAGDVTALADVAAVRLRINRLFSEIVEDVLGALGARGLGAPGDARWMDRRVDLWRVLSNAQRPQRSAKRLIASAIAHDDFLTVEMLTSGELRIFLGSLAIDVRALQITAVRLLSEREGVAPVAGVRFIVAQDGGESVHNLVEWARMLTPAF